MNNNECENLVHMEDQDFGYKRWYCNKTKEFLFDTQECTILDCKNYNEE